MEAIREEKRKLHNKLWTGRGNQPLVLGGKINTQTEGKQPRSEDIERKRKTEENRRISDNDIDADGAQNVQITIYPTEAQVREGRDVTFDCRARTADNTVYPTVR